MKTVEAGKYYRVRALGYDNIILKYTGIEKANHCKTCVCTRPEYTQISGPSVVGTMNDLEFLEEVSKPVGC